jgi:hypothetical protein
MNKLMLVITLTVVACGGSDNNNTPVDAPPQQPDAAAGLQCFSGTPTNNDQLMNACVDQTVTVIHKAPVLPLLNSDGTLPPLP